MHKDLFVRKLFSVYKRNFTNDVQETHTHSYAKKLVSRRTTLYIYIYIITKNISNWFRWVIYLYIYNNKHTLNNIRKEILILLPIWLFTLTVKLKMCRFLYIKFYFGVKSYLRYTSCSMQSLPKEIHWDEKICLFIFGRLGFLLFRDKHTNIHIWIKVLYNCRIWCRDLMMKKMIMKKIPGKSTYFRNFSVCDKNLWLTGLSCFFLLLLYDLNKKLRVWFICRLKVYLCSCLKGYCPNCVSKRACIEETFGVPLMVLNKLHNIISIVTIIYYIWGRQKGRDILEYCFLKRYVQT